jgi:hypothetical protein
MIATAQTRYNQLLNAARTNAAQQATRKQHVEVLDEGGTRFAIKMIPANTRIGYTARHYVNGIKVGGRTFMDMLGQLQRNPAGIR